jgi:oxaloacetate decarboxylase
MMDLDYLSARNVRVCLQGHQSFWGAVQGIYDTLKALRQGAMPSDLKNIASAELQRRVLRQDEVMRSAKEFLGGG